MGWRHDDTAHVPVARRFKQALEQRLLTLAASGAALARQRQLLVFDRFMVRVVAELGDAAILKGGLALELRIDGARSTNDVDLRMTGSPRLLLARLQAAANRDTGDHLGFEVSPDAIHPEIHAEGMPYDGFRFRATCQLARMRATTGSPGAPSPT